MKQHQIVEQCLPLNRIQKTQGHKYAHGHVLVVSGGRGQTGAARLAARAALRIGAGLVTLAVPPSAVCEVASQITAVMMKTAQDHRALSRFLDDERLNTVCMGPGLGVHERAAELIAATLASPRDTVLDADALTLVARDASLRSALHPRCVLTPHGGEFDRLFPDISERMRTDPQCDKAMAAALAAQRVGCVVLLKGAQTVVARPDGTVGLHNAEGARAAPWLATAGSGDVLAGLISGLLARGIDAATAAETAVYLHAEVARDFGPGLIAEDISEHLPKTLSRLLD